MIAQTSEHGRQIILASGVALGALLCVVQPWQLVDAFVYPPHAKMLLLPFGAMPSLAAVTIWTALNLFCLFRAAELLNLQHDPRVLAGLLPAALIMMATGYPAGFLSLMAAIVVMRGHARPGLAGLCLALATVHPPLALVFAVLLLPFGYWHTVAVAGAWVVGLVAVSVVVLGLDAWASYLAPAAAAPMPYGAMP